MSRWIDIETAQGERQEAHLEGVVFSYRMNLDGILMAKRVIKSAENAAKLTGMSEMDIDDIGGAVEHRVVIENPW